MVDNVVSFPKRHSVLSEAAPEMAQFMKDNGAPHSLANLFLGLAEDRVRDVLSDNILANVEYSVNSSTEHNNKQIVLNTNFRPNLCPEFGTQNHLLFLAIGIVDLPDGLKPQPFPTESDNLMQRMTDYVDQYKEVHNANLVAFCYTLIDGVLRNDEFEYVLLDTSDMESLKSKLVFGITEKPYEKLYYFEIDFLPILLDNCAMEFWKEKLEGE